MATTAGASPAVFGRSGIWCEQDSPRAVSPEHREQLVNSLRAITGYGNLRFDDEGRLIGYDGVPDGGAPTARRILADAAGAFPFVIEDHSGSDQVTFAQIDEGTVVTYADEPERRDLVWRIRIDFDDFAPLQGSATVRTAFDPGFALLHELLHGLGRHDAARTDAPGSVEALVNVVRAELGLPLRACYLAQAAAGIAGRFLVRLPFRHTGERGATEYLSFFFETLRPSPPSVTSALVALSGIAPRGRVR
jgi:hypothetical protein